jgi:hypothetical protein
MPNILIAEQPPYAPLLTTPPNGSFADLSGTPTFAGSYVPDNATGGMTGYALRFKQSGASSYSYYNASTGMGQGTIVYNAATSLSVAVAQGVFANGLTWAWSFSTEDAGGQGPFAADSLVTGRALNLTLTGPLVEAGPAVVGQRIYDVAIGYQDPVSGEVLMVGYVLTPDSTYQESTDLQDEQHLVQIASPLSTDRYGRYPKVSQGDWSGGERQLYYETATQFYQSTQCDVSRPGHLRCWGAYSQITLPANAVISGRSIAADAQAAYLFSSADVMVYDIAAAAAYTQAFSGGSNPLDIVEGSNLPYLATGSGSGPGIYSVSYNAGTHAITQVQAVDDVVSVVHGGVMTSFDGNFYYVTASPNQVNSFTYPLPGANPGTVDYTMPTMLGYIAALCDSPTGLAWCTQGTNAVESQVWTFDGTLATYVGRLVSGQVLDMVQANGIVYILVAAPTAGGAGAGQPVIYTLTGSTLAPFDDYRYVDPAFQSKATSFAQGRLDTDGTYLYLFWPGLDVKAYVLATGAIYDVGRPDLGADTTHAHMGCAEQDGGFFELSGLHLGDLYHNQPSSYATPSANGVLTTSFFDFGTPTVYKAFKSVEFAMNTALNVNAISVSFRTDVLSNPLTPMTLQLSPSGDSLIAYFPPRTLGHQVQLVVTLAAGYAPDIKTYSILATLARTWQFTVACRRNQKTRGGQDDLQGAKAQDLLANLVNAYRLAAGNIVMWIPDPAVTPVEGSPVGVTQVNAQIQDYQWTVHAAPGPTWQKDESGQQDQEGDVALVLTEVL